MKVIINESKRDVLIFNWLNEEYGNLKYKVSNSDPKWYFFIKNGKVVMDYLTKYKRFTMDKDITNFLDSFFGINYFDAKKIVGKWFQETYGLDVEIVTTPVETIRIVWNYMSDN